jgi:hypothetical protein
MASEDTTTTEQPVQRKAYLSVDIEGSGASFDNPTIAIGVCVGYQDKKEVIAKRTFCFEATQEEFEERCYNEFWVGFKLLDLLERIRANAKPLKEGMTEFLEFITDLEVQFPKRNLTIITDNPSYDLTHIDVMLHRLFKRPPLRYTSQGEYRWVEDPSDVVGDLGKKEEFKESVKFEVEHDHWPENDAHFNYLMMLYRNELIKDIKENYLEKEDKRKKSKETTTP